jgi:hypothetical protein
MMIVYHNAREMIVCAAEDEERVKADFFKTRSPARYTRIVTTDYAYARASAARFQSLEGQSFGPPNLLVSSNLSD